MPRACSVELTNRSGSAELPPVTFIGAGLPPTSKPVDLLSAESDGDSWRIIELWSLSELPFDAHLSWSAGSGSGAHARVTVARAARIALHARSLRIQGLNHADRVNQVACTVADGFAATRNQSEHRARHLEVANPSVIPVPPFAERVRIDIPGIHPTAVLRLRDGIGRIRATVRVSDQPLDGLPLGGVASLELFELADVDYRAVFLLTL